MEGDRTVSTLVKSISAIGLLRILSTTMSCSNVEMINEKVSSQLLTQVNLRRARHLNDKTQVGNEESVPRVLSLTRG